MIIFTLAGDCENGENDPTVKNILYNNMVVPALQLPPMTSVAQWTRTSKVAGSFPARVRLFPFT